MKEYAQTHTGRISCSKANILLNCSQTIVTEDLETLFPVHVSYGCAKSTGNIMHAKSSERILGQDGKCGEPNCLKCKVTARFQGDTSDK